MKPGLQHEIKKKQPFELPEQEAMLNLLRTADRIELVFMRFFRGYGLSSAQYNILRILRGEGGEGIPSLEIASRMITSVPDITRLVDRLEGADLVVRDRCLQDRRIVRVRLTEKGLDLLGRLDAPVLELHRQILGHMSREELDALSLLLVKARNPSLAGDRAIPPCQATEESNPRVEPKSSCGAGTDLPGSSESSASYSLEEPI